MHFFLTSMRNEFAVALSREDALHFLASHAPLPLQLLAVNHSILNAVKV
jgi:hypothetical protein